VGFWSGAAKGATTGAIIGAAVFGTLTLLTGSFMLAIPVAIAGGLQWGLIGGIINGVIGALTPEPKQGIPVDAPAPRSQSKNIPVHAQDYPMYEQSPQSVGVSSSYVQREANRRQAAALQQRGPKFTGVS
jgi:hypothetical protein